MGNDAAVLAGGRGRADDVSAGRDLIGIGSDAPLFASIAELHPNKRHDRTIEAVSRMQRTDGHLAIAGTGASRESFEPDAAIEVVPPFEQTHDGSKEMTVRDPDGRLWLLQEPAGG